MPKLHKDETCLEILNKCQAGMTNIVLVHKDAETRAGLDYKEDTFIQALDITIHCLEVAIERLNKGNTRY